MVRVEAGDPRQRTAEKHLTPIAPWCLTRKTIARRRMEWTGSDSRNPAVDSCDPRPRCGGIQNAAPGLLVHTERHHLRTWITNHPPHPARPRRGVLPVGHLPLEPDVSDVPRLSLGTNHSDHLSTIGHLLSAAIR